MFHSDRLPTAPLGVITADIPFGYPPIPSLLHPPAPIPGWEPLLPLFDPGPDVVGLIPHAYF